MSRSKIDNTRFPCLQVQVSKIWIRKAMTPRKPCLIIENQRAQQRPLEPVGETKQCIQYALTHNKSFEFSLNTKASNVRISVKSDENEEICFVEHSISEIVYRNDYGKYYLLAMEGSGSQKIDYSVDPKLQSYHILKQMPYAVEFMVMEKADNTPLILESYRLRKKLNVWTVPTRYGGVFQLKPVSVAQMQTYQRVFALPQAKAVTKQSILKLNQVVVREFEKQENKSKNAALFSKPLQTRLLNGEKLDAVSLLRLFERGPKERVKVYETILMPKYDLLFKYSYDTLASRLDEIGYADMRNLNEDLSAWSILTGSPVSNMLHGYLVLRSVCKKEIQLIYSKQLIRLAERMYELVCYNERSTDSQVCLNRAFKLFVVFVSQVLPYYRDGGAAQFTKDLACLRVLIKKLLRQFNYTLNKQMMGLENIISPHLLNAFSTQYPELTYRIWDILVFASADPTKSVMPILGYTYLNYLQSNGMTQYIPINNFIASLVHNINRIDPNQHSGQHIISDVLKATELYSKRARLCTNLAKQIYVRRFLLSEPELSVEDENSLSNLDRTTHASFKLPEKSTLNPGYRSPFPLNSINYPLPEANFNSTQITKFHLLIKKLNIYIPWSKPTIQLLSHDKSKKIALLGNVTERHSFVNHYHCVNRNEKDAKAVSLVGWEGFSIQILSSSERQDYKLVSETVMFEGVYHRDTAYKLSLRLLAENINLKSNLAESTVDIIFMLESERVRKHPALPKSKYSDLVPKSMADYDFQQKLNSSIKAMRLLSESFEKIKHPLDEYGQPYSSVQVSALGSTQYSWLRSNKKSFIP